MNIGISNIAWPVDLQPEVADLLQSLGVTGIEIAPTRVWSSPLDVPARELAAFRRFWNDHGLQIIALQSLLFGLDLSLFESAESRAVMRRHLAGMIRLCAELGGRALVFGSPKHRRRGDLPIEEASRIALDFFTEIGACAAQHGVAFCIEANPTAYDCDFVTTSTEAIALVERVANPGFAVHLDTGAMTLSEEPIEQAVINAMTWCRHFHVSEPQLGPIGTGGVNHQAFAATLKMLNYSRWISIEMRQRARESCLRDVAEAIAFTQRTYGG
jgi:D-psicose/D-tagatose/L-ribulose 3-epimerase